MTLLQKISLSRRYLLIQSQQWNHQKTKNDIFSKLIIKTPGRRSGVSIFKFEQILHIVRVNK